MRLQKCQGTRAFFVMERYGEIAENDHRPQVKQMKQQMVMRWVTEMQLPICLLLLLLTMMLLALQTVTLPTDDCDELPKTAT